MHKQHFSSIFKNRNGKTSVSWSGDVLVMIPGHQGKDPTNDENILNVLSDSSKVTK